MEREPVAIIGAVIGSIQAGIAMIMALGLIAILTFIAVASSLGLGD